MSVLYNGVQMVSISSQECKSCLIDAVTINMSEYHHLITRKAHDLF